MPSLNRVIIMGHITKDAQMRYTQKGDPVTNLTVAVNRSFDDDADFIDVTIWNQGNYKLAEYRAEDEKGDLLLVEGELRQDRWENNDGENRSKIVIRADQAFNLSQNGNKGNDNSDDEEDIDVEDIDDEFGDVPF